MCALVRDGTLVWLLSLHLRPAADLSLLSQCYFVTHLLYVCSDWGAQPLSRALFAEELCFIIRYTPQVLRLKDPELVAEFVHCLRLFQVWVG
jgi:hypothetical protein